MPSGAVGSWAQIRRRYLHFDLEAVAASSLVFFVAAALVDLAAAFDSRLATGFLSFLTTGIFSLVVSIGNMCLVVLVWVYAIRHSDLRFE